MDSLEKLGLGAKDELLKIHKTGDGPTRGRATYALGLLSYKAIKDGNDHAGSELEDVLVKALGDSSEDVFCYAAQALTNKEPRSKKAIPFFWRAPGA